MPHNYNRTAFASGINNANANPLLSLYCSLVVLELAIKDYLYTTNGGTWVTGHKIILWLDDLNESSLSRQLSTALSTLYCTAVNGSEVSVCPHKYPDIRYLRHGNDFPGKSTDTQIRDALGIISDIRTRLIVIGVQL